MKFIVRALVVVVLVFGLGNYLIYLKTGQSPISKIRENYSGDLLTAIKESYPSAELMANAKKTVDGLTQDEAAPPPPTKVFKWTDANGVVHYGDKPDAASAKQVEVKIQNAISPPDESGSDSAD